MHSNTIRRAWVDLLSQSKHIVSCGCLYDAQFICTILCSAYTTLLQKVTRYACDYRIKYHKVLITYSFPFCCGPRGSGLDVMTSARQCTGTTFVLIVLIRSVCCRHWKAKDVLLAGSFWLSALRLMDQSQEIYWVILYFSTSEYSMTQLSSYCMID